jgi:hypothetical protein
MGHGRIEGSALAVAFETCILPLYADQTIVNYRNRPEEERKIGTLNVQSSICCFC